MTSSDSWRYLARRADVLRERAKLEGLRGQALRAQRVNLRAARREEGLELALSEPARELATQQAEQGDVQAAEALTRVSALDEADIRAEREARTCTRDGAITMPPEAPAPFIQLRSRLACARAEGAPFNAAWASALEDWPVTAWRLAAHGTATAWRRAYEGEPDGRGCAIARLADAIVEPEDLAADARGVALA